MAVKRDERAWNGVTKMSGSSVYENMLCLARFKASQKFKDYDTSDASAGTQLHSYMEDGVPLDEISDNNERFIIQECRRMEDIVTKKFGLKGSVSREPRLWLKDEKDELGILSGQIDRLEIDGEDASILDYKMLYGNYEEAHRNKQLQVYAMLVFENYPEVQQIQLALLQPALGKCTTGIMHRDLGMILKGLIRELAIKVEDEEAEETAGPKQCKYCKALAHCPTAFEYLKNETKEIDMENISNDELAEKMGLVGLIERFGKSVKSATKSRLEAGVDVPGYKLRNTGSTTSFDAAGAAEILFGSNLPVKEFLQAVKISEPDLVTIWAEFTKQGKAQARKDLRQRLEQVMFQKAKAKSVTAE
jgi:hypothetical protein